MSFKLALHSLHLFTKVKKKHNKRYYWDLSSLWFIYLRSTLGFEIQLQVSEIFIAVKCQVISVMCAAVFGINELYSPIPINDRHSF
jgi:hypothetical protein